MARYPETERWGGVVRIARIVSSIRLSLPAQYFFRKRNPHWSSCGTRARRRNRLFTGERLWRGTSRSSANHIDSRQLRSHLITLFASDSFSFVSRIVPNRVNDNSFFV